MRQVERADGRIPAPADGSSFARAIGFPGRLLLPLLFRLRPNGLVPSEAMIRKELCSDLDDADCEMVLQRYEAEFSGLYLSRVSGPPRCPSAYIKLMKDASVSRVQQARMIGRLNDPKVFELDAGHLVMLAQPQRLADTINAVVGST